MKFSEPVLKTLIICAFQLSLLLIPAVMNGQVNDGEALRKWSVSGSFYACRESVGDDAYSSAAYMGWMPTFVLASQLRLHRQVHLLSVNYGQGTCEHPSVGSGKMQNTQWGVTYEWLYRLDHLNGWERVCALFGAAFSWNQMSREYDGFVNDRKIMDKWGGLGLKAGLELCLSSNGRLGMRMDGQLGLAGFYNIGQKQPEAGPLQEEDAGGSFTWMPGKNAFNAKAGVGVHYIIGVNHFIEAGYNFQIDKYSSTRQWGFQRQGITLTYTYFL